MEQLSQDTRGAVFVEKLIVYLPLLATFFGAWELAELAAAHLVVQRASAAAGRAAVVVLPDSPAFYDGEEVHSYAGQRRADIELAAGMILSAIPRLRDDFSVDVGDVPEGMGPLEVSVEANYDCSLVSLLCGDDEAVTLTATTTHTYQGARYAYSDPANVGGSGSALTDGSGSFRASKPGSSGTTSSSSGPGAASGSGSSNKDKKLDKSCESKESGIPGVDFNADKMFEQPDGWQEYNEFIKDLRTKLNLKALDESKFNVTIQVNGEKMTLTFQTNNLYLTGINGKDVPPTYTGNPPDVSPSDIFGAFSALNESYDGTMNPNVRAIIGFTAEAARFGEVRNEFVKSLHKGQKANLGGAINDLLHDWGPSPKRQNSATAKSKAKACEGLGNATGLGDPCTNLNGDGLKFGEVRPIKPGR